MNLPITDNWIKSRGVKMCKLISQGGVFFSPTYDNRIAYSWKDIDRLTSEGFGLTEPDIAAWNLLKMVIIDLMNYKDE